MQLLQITENNIILEIRNRGYIDQYFHYPNAPQRKGSNTSEKPSFLETTWEIMSR